MQPSHAGRQTFAKEEFAALDWTGKTVHESCFTDCVFEGCRFPQATLAGCKFHDCTFKSCDLTTVKVPGSVFPRVTFLSSKVAGVMWWEARAALFRVNFKECLLNYSSFCGMDLAGASFVGCTAIDVDFQEANLSGVSFDGTDLQQSKFLHTNLSHADFSKARHYGIDPTVNILCKTAFSMPEAVALLDRFDIVWKA